MSRFPEPTDPDDWQPATSRPGEIFTPEGGIRAARAFAIGAKNRDPRVRAYRRGMRRTAAMIGGVVMAVGVLVLVLMSLL